MKGNLIAGLLLLNVDAGRGQKVGEESQRTLLKGKIAKL